LRNADTGPYWTDRLRGTTINSYNFLRSPQNNAEYYVANSGGAGFGLNNNIGVVDSNFWTGSGNAFYWNFRRAPQFFDEVCYRGTGTSTNFTHNLGVVPELMIVKRRDASSIWAVYVGILANASTNYLELSSSNAIETGNTVLWDSTAPTSTVFTIGPSSNINTNGSSNVAYLFATCAGVSKVGSYTGTGSTQTINCAFTGGARWVMIKRTNGLGDWVVFDTARGMVVGNDPQLFMNYAGAEENVLTVYTATTGFQVVGNQSSVNASGGTYIYLAIA
jgi:hypothetical protein